MSKITLQQIFNAAWQAFIVEGKPAASDDFSCRYKTWDGRKCAVGLVLPDDLDTDNIGSFYGLVRHHPELFDSDLQQADAKYLNTFQVSLHDNLVRNNEWAHSLDERKQRYEACAAQYGLTVPGQEYSNE